jgi:electron transport complex protein RnfD
MVKAPMTKKLLMQYTMIALFFIAFLSYWAFGLDSLVITLISVGVAIGCDILLSMVMGSKSPKDMMSAIVFGLIVAMSYSLGEPLMRVADVVTVAGGLEQYLYPALISALGMIVFKKIAGLAGRKYVNPAAIAKLIVLALLFMPAMVSLFPADHLASVNLMNPLTPGAFGLPDYYPMDTEAFGSTLMTCYSHPQTDLMNPYSLGSYDNPLPDVLFVMLVGKYHGWIGGFSSVLVMAVGLIFFAVAKGYIKWRITLSYLVTTAVVSAIMGVVFGGDIIMRVIFHVFMGSSIFMAFFMATDPATTPITRTGQNIFGIGLAVITVLIQTMTNFLGASIVGLVIMNLTCPLLDKVGAPKASSERIKVKLPKGQRLGNVMETKCIRCGKCMTICCKNIPVLLVKEAADKGDWAKVEKLGAAECVSCGSCTFVCPARIDLMSIVVAAKDKIQK